MELVEFKEEVADDYFDEIQLMLKLKEGIDEKCRSIIDLRFGIGSTEENDNKVVRFDEIAEKLNISPDNARQRFGRCFTKLKKLLLSNPHFNQLID
jgi:DNA-directed RNA polymerase sigma subunit (sigma70/sigma32)